MSTVLSQVAEGQVTVTPQATPSDPDKKLSTANKELNLLQKMEAPTESPALKTYSYRYLYISDESNAGTQNLRLLLLTCRMFPVCVCVDVCELCAGNFGHVT